MFLVQIGAGLGPTTDGFGFSSSWASAGMTVVIEANTNLAQASWSPVATNQLTGGAAYFNDPNWRNYPARFYRLRWFGP
jgi:hypothetical protein